MNKLFIGLLVTAALATASCSQDLDMPQTGGDATLSISLDVPTFSSRTYSDGLSATHLQYAVYDVTTGEAAHIGALDGDIDDFNGHRTITLNLVSGRTYGIAFWAAHPESPYTVTFDESAATMQADYTTITANDDKYDAFYTYIETPVNGAKAIKAELRRPFAQVNFGTNDTEASKTAGYEPATSKIVISEVYSGFNLFDGEVTGEPIELAYEHAALPDPQEETFPGPGEYDYLAMAYVLTPASQSLVDVTLYHKNEGGDEYNLPVSNVPVQRNYRTNLYGALLTDPLSVEVVTKPEYEGENNQEVIDVPEGQAMMNDEYYPSIKDAIAAIQGNEATIYIGAGDWKTSEQFVFPSTFSGVNITFKGTAGSETALTIDKGVYVESKANIAFEDLKIINPAGNTYNESEYMQFVRINDISYKNCEIQGCVKVSAFGDVLFDGCKFTNTVKSGFDGYSIYYYAYTGSKVVVETCTFDVVSKAIVLYNEGAQVYDLTVNNSTFTATTKDDKAAIQMHTEAGAISGTVRINNTTADNFDDTRHEGLWCEEKNNAQPFTETYNFDIYVDGELVHTSNKITVNGNKYNTLAEALNAATDGSTLELGQGEYDVKEALKSSPLTSNLELTFKGLNPNMSKLVNMSYFDAPGCKYHFNDLSLDVEHNTTNHTAMGLRQLAEGTYDNVVVNGEYHLFSGNHTFNKCVFNYVKESDATNGGRYNLYGQAEGNTIVRNCEFNNVSSKAFLVYKEGNTSCVAGDIEFSDCKFKSTGTDKQRAVFEIHSENFTGAGTLTLNNIEWESNAYKSLWQEILGGPYFTVVVDGAEQQNPNN